MDLNNIVLYDEEGIPCEYEIIDMFEMKDNTYLGVVPLEMIDEDDLEVTMLKVTEENEEEAFIYIDDENEELEAFNELLRRESLDEDDE